MANDYFNFLVDFKFLNNSKISFVSESKK